MSNSGCIFGECNTPIDRWGLGHFKDNSERLRLAAKYLEKHNGE